MSRTNLIRSACVALACGVLAPALANRSAKLTFSTPTNKTDKTVKVVIDPRYKDVQVVIPAEIPDNPNDPNGPKHATTVQEKRHLIAEALRNAVPAYSVVEGPITDPNDPDYPLGDDELKIKSLRDGTTVRFKSNGTGETRDGLKGKEAIYGTMNFQGLFEPLDSDDQPAVFTAGIVTDVGELAAQVSAEELDFQTDGPTICQALYEQLAPQAPLYGGEILLSDTDDRLEIYFDPAYSVEIGGVIFGTTSPSEGCSGGVTFSGTPCWEDIDGDGVVGLGDLAALLASYGLAEGDPGFDPGADLDGDGIVNVVDLATLLAAYGNECP